MPKSERGYLIATFTVALYVLQPQLNNNKLMTPWHSECHGIPCLDLREPSFLPLPRMHKFQTWFCYLTIAVPCFAQVSPLAPPPATNAPRLVCEQPSFDFGSVYEASVVEHEFVVHNAGSAPLSIANVRASCGCTVASLQDSIVAPGTQTVIRTRLSLQGRRGHQSKSITVQSNDPLCPVQTLWLNGTVTVEAALDPPYVNFGSITPETDMTREVQLQSRRPEVTVTNVTCDSPVFAVSLWDEPGRKGKGFAIRTVPPLGDGQTRATVTAFLDHPDRRELRITVVAFVPQEVRVLPQQIILQRGFEAPAVRTIVLYPGTVREYKVLNVENPSPAVRHSVQRVAPGSYRIDFMNLTPSEELQGKSVRILTDLAKMKEILVPIRIVD